MRLKRVGWLPINAKPPEVGRDSPQENGYIS